MKLRYKISIWVALALASYLFWGGSIWLWLAGICVGKLLIRLLLTIALAVVVYILTYALIIGGIIVYIDGFNFYYGLKSTTRWRKYYWLDIVKLFESFM